MSVRTPEKKQRRYYSGKKKRPTPKAQIIPDPATAFCCGKQADFALFKASRTALTTARLCLADSGYQGRDKIRPNAQTPQKKSKHHPLTDDQKGSNRAISREGIRCEHALARLKVFKILAHAYRNRRKRFALRFNLLAAICNLERSE